MKLETYERNGFTVEIWADEDGRSANPRDADGEVSGLVMWGRKYNFPNDADVCLDGTRGWGEVAERLLRPYTVVDEETAEVLGRFAAESGASERIAALPETVQGYGIDVTNGGEAALVVLPVWVYEHSSIALSAGDRSYPFDDAWDSAQAGVAYMTSAHWRNLMGDDAAWTGSEEQTARAVKVLQAAVEDYGRYVNGEVYGYSILDQVGEVVESCGGHLGYETVQEAANEAADEAEHEAKCNGRLNRRAGVIEHDGPCPLHQTGE